MNNDMLDLTKHGYKYNPLLHRWEHPIEGFKLVDIPPTPLSALDIYNGYVYEKNGELRLNFPKYKTIAFFIAYD